MIATFNYCPSCGEKDTIHDHDGKAFRCTGCDFLVYVNAAAAVAAILTFQDKILLAIRGKEPGLGRLDLPGGFVDNGESAEAAIVRELKEELGLEIEPPAYFGSYPNTYPYEGILYHTIDLIYCHEFRSEPTLVAMDDVAGYRWVKSEEVPLQEVAFVSLRNALMDYRERTASAPSHGEVDKDDAEHSP